MVSTAESTIYTSVTRVFFPMSRRRDMRVLATMGGYTARLRGACRAQCDPGPPGRPTRPAGSRPWTARIFPRRYTRMSQIEQVAWQVSIDDTLSACTTA